MSLHETPLLRRYRKKVGGILIEEFPAVRRSSDRGPRFIDRVIIRRTERRSVTYDEVSLRGKHITVIQVKRGRLSMSLMGQALFSIDLVLPFEPASVQAVALCEKDDAILRPLFERHPHCRVVTSDELRDM